MTVWSAVFTAAFALLWLSAAPAAAADAGDQASMASKLSDVCWEPPPSGVPDVNIWGYGRCLIRDLAFDPGRYFEPDFAATELGPGGPLADAVYSNTYRGPLWAFAVDLECPYKGEPNTPPRCVSLMRVVTWRHADQDDPIPEFLRSLVETAKQTPGSPPFVAVRNFLDASLNWWEVDLRTCPRATAQLLSLEKVSWSPFHDLSRERVATGGPLEEESIYEGQMPNVNRIAVRVFDDGGSVVPGVGRVVRASAQADAPGTSAWAQKMLNVVRPCLKPAKTPAPWDRD